MLNATSADHRIALEYWNREETTADSDLAGVAAIGGGGLTEVLYRHYEELRHLRRIVTFDAQTSMLELGCGNGRWVESLAPLVDHYVAVDYSKPMIEIAKARAQRLGLQNVTFTDAPAQEFVPSRTFDVVYLGGVSQYLHDADLKDLLRRVRGYLRPDGVVVDRSTIHRSTRMVSPSPGYFCIYRTASDVKALFASENLVNVYQKESYPFLGFPRRVHAHLNRPQVRRLLRATIPASWMALRGAARLCRPIWGRTGELADYSHDFFLFTRARS